jgi:hypothetical protein
VFVGYLWLHLVCLMLMFELIRASAYLNPFASTSEFLSAFKLFLGKNVREDGVNKKTVRFFDTLGKGPFTEFICKRHRRKMHFCMQDDDQIG